MGNQNYGMSDRDAVNQMVNNNQQRVEVLSTQLGSFVASAGVDGTSGSLLGWIFKTIGKAGGMVFYLFLYGPVRYIFLSFLIYLMIYAPLVYITQNIFHRPLPFIYDPFFLNSGMSSLYASESIPEGALFALKILLSPISYLMSFYSSLSELQYQPLSVAVLILSTFPLFVVMELLSVSFIIFLLAGLNLTIIIHQIFLGNLMPFLYGDFWVGDGFLTLSLVFFILLTLNYYFQPVFFKQMRSLSFNVMGEPPSNSFVDTALGNNVLKSPIRSM